MKQRKKLENKTTTRKLEALLNQIQQFLENANAAALARTKALAKWQAKYELSSDSSDD